MAYFCYMVECADGTYYTGWSTDPDRRVKVHNAGRGARYTSQRRPVTLVYVEVVDSHSAALKRERAMKKLDHQRKKKLVDQYAILSIHPEVTRQKKLPRFPQEF